MTKSRFLAATIFVLLVVLPAAAKDSAIDIVRKAANVIDAQHKAHPRYSYRMVRADLTVRGKDSLEERYEARVYTEGGRIERIEYLIGKQGSHAVTEAELKRMSERADESRKRQASFRPPYETSALAEYDYQVEGEASIAGRHCFRLRFRSRIADAQHANGQMWVDIRSFNVVKLSYEFARNPAGVEQSLIEVYRAPALVDLWSPVRLYQKIYRGEQGYEESAFINSDFREP